MKNGLIKQWVKSLINAGIVICLMTACSFIMIRWVNNYEEEKAYEKLYSEAKQWENTIERYIKWDHETLEIIAIMISEYDDFQSSELWDILDSYNMVGLMSSLEILMPDDSVIKSGGERIYDDGQSFASESEKGNHITDRLESPEKKGVYIVRHYVPIQKNGITVAMLYGIVDLNNLIEKSEAKPYDGKASLCIVDGNTGDYLVDPWHDTLGNIWELGERELKEGYTTEDFVAGITNGNRGYVVFISQTTGEYLYLYCTPMTINEWRLIIHVPEEVVFQDAKAIQKSLYLFLLFEIICFVLYFIWICLQGIHSYRKLRARGEQDLLLGIYNRNRYEIDIKQINQDFKNYFACIYIDVNGLHELNNQSGHEAGDQMLKRVATELKILFGNKHTYRIGGDEFIVFITDVDEAQVAKKCNMLEENLKKENIYVSIGFKWVEKLTSINKIIKEAEQKMYEAKKKFYQQDQFDRRRNNFNN